MLNKVIILPQITHPECPQKNSKFISLFVSLSPADDQVQVGSPEEKSENTGDDCDDEDEDDDISRHRCLQCDKHFGDYDE